MHQTGDSGTARSVARRRLLLMALALVGLLVSAAPVAAQTTDDTPPPDASDVPTAYGTSLSTAALPGFYAAAEFPTSSFPAVGLDLDSETGLLWATTFDHELVVRDQSGAVVDTFGSFGTAETQFKAPSGIAIDDGEVFVAEIDNDRVQVLSTSGAHLRFIGESSLSGPCGIVVVGNLLYVTSEGSPDTVHIFTRNGAAIDTFDGLDSGTGLDPWCQLDSLTSDGEWIYVADYWNDRIAVFDLDGNWERDVPVTRPSAIDYADGKLWLAQWGHNAVEVYTLAGALVGDITLTGADLGQLSGPFSIVADPSGSAFWVGDANNSRIQVFTDLTCVGRLLTQVGTSFPDTFDGTAGNDVVHLLGGGDTYHAAGGDDIVCADTGTDRVWGDAGNDRLYGGGNSDQLWGGIGNDLLRGGTRFDRLYGEHGNDTIYGDQHSDLAYGGPGDDTMYGSYGNDRLFGQGGADRIYGEGNNDKLYGGPGYDRLWGGNGIDRIWGETGNDDLYGQGDDDSWLDGGDHNDRVYGGGGADVVRGGNGRDRVYGQGGDDDVRAQAGDDWVTDGGPGVDSCQVAPSDTPGGDNPAINCE